MSSSIQYELPTTEQTLLLGAFLFLLSATYQVAQRILHAGPLGQILLGALYGAPLGNLLPNHFQTACIDIGYVGLILLVFEGALATDLRLFIQHVALSTLGAITGVAVPIGFSFLFLNTCLGYSTLQAFAAGASLSATSLGTTIAILKAGDTKGESIFNTVIATVLLSVAIIDDVIALILASIISGLGGGSHGPTQTLGWAIGRPILASTLLALAVFLLAGILDRINIRRYWRLPFVQRHQDKVNLCILLGCLAAISAAAAYAGTSILFGAFLAGLFLSHIGGGGESNDTEPGGYPPNFLLIQHCAFGQAQDLIFSAFFFASIGFAIPIRKLWKATVVWQGILYSLFMILSKITVGIWIPLWAPSRRKCPNPKSQTMEPRTDAMHGQEESSTSETYSLLARVVYPSLFIGTGMVARGEIGLLIAQIAYNGGHGPLPDDLFAITIWALVLSTVIGPLLISAVLAHGQDQLLSGPWGRVARMEQDDQTAADD